MAVIQPPRISTSLVSPALPDTRGVFRMVGMAAPTARTTWITVRTTRARGVRVTDVTDVGVLTF